MWEHHYGLKELISWKNPNALRDITVIKITIPCLMYLRKLGTSE